MPLNRRNTKKRHRVLYGGQSGQKVILYKRGDDQRQGTVTVHTQFVCRRGQIIRTGETLRGRLLANCRTTWQIPFSELKRHKIRYLNPTDMIHDPVENFTWQPESTTFITEKLFGNTVMVECLGTDPVLPE